MARSSYIYEVNSCHVAVGLFTVKHEMVTAVQAWLDAHPGSTAKRLGLRIHRHRDGKIEPAVNVTEQFVWRE